MNDQGMWCTLKEYQKINNFAKSNTLRHLQELAKKGALLSPSRKKDPLRKTGAYLVNVTDQSEINRLLVLRATQKDRNAKSKTPARKRRIDIQVLEGSGEEYGTCQ